MGKGYGLARNRNRNKDYYSILGVEPQSHFRVIEETYWEQAHDLHLVPTRKAQRRLKALNEAYETLGTPHKRAEYDRRMRGAGRNGNGNGHHRGGLLQSFVSLLGKPFRPD